VDAGEGDARGYGIKLIRIGNTEFVWRHITWTFSLPVLFSWLGVPAFFLPVLDGTLSGV